MYLLYIISIKYRLLLNFLHFIEISDFHFKHIVKSLQPNLILFCFTFLIRLFVPCLSILLKHSFYIFVRQSWSPKVFYSFHRNALALLLLLFLEYSFHQQSLFILALCLDLLNQSFVMFFHSFLFIQQRSLYHTLFLEIIHILLVCHYKLIEVVLFCEILFWFRFFAKG